MDSYDVVKDGLPIREDEYCEDHTSIDAKGFPGNLFSGRKKKTDVPKPEVEQTDSQDRIPKYNMDYAAGSLRGQAVIINNENFHWMTSEFV